MRNESLHSHLLPFCLLHHSNSEITSLGKLQSPICSLFSFHSNNVESAFIHIAKPFLFSCTNTHFQHRRSVTKRESKENRVGADSSKEERETRSSRSSFLSVPQAPKTFNFFQDRTHIHSENRSLRVSSQEI